MKSIIRVEHAKNYTCIANDAIRDSRLSLKARGLHHLLLSYPDNWKISIEHLAKVASDSDKHTAVQGALKELEEAGYLTRSQCRNKKGRITGCEYVIRELPVEGNVQKQESPEVESPEVESPEVESPEVENPHMEKPAMENQRLISNDSYEVSTNEVSIPPTPQREGEEDTLTLEEEETSSTKVVPRTKAKSPRQPKRPAPDDEPGSAALPWHTEHPRQYDPEFEEWMRRSLINTTYYKSLPPEQVLAKVRNHIAKADKNVTHREKLLIEWEAMQSIHANRPVHKAVVEEFVPAPIPEEVKQKMEDLKRRFGMGAKKTIGEKQ